MDVKSQTRIPAGRVLMGNLFVMNALKGWFINHNSESSTFFKLLSEMHRPLYIIEKLETADGIEWLFKHWNAGLSYNDVGPHEWKFSE